MYYGIKQYRLHMINYCTWTSYMYPRMSCAYDGQYRK